MTRSQPVSSIQVGSYFQLRSASPVGRRRRRRRRRTTTTTTTTTTTITLWDVMAHWLRRLLSTGGSWVRLPLWPSRRDLGQVLYLQLPGRFGVKLRYSIRAVVGSASEW